MKAFKSIALSLIFALGLSAQALAALPWGTTGGLQVSGATPTCTYTSTALACIEDMTTNVTSITLAGMTAGVYYTLVLMQDGTGSRTLTQASVTGAPALTSAESAANGYAVWVIKATSASAATFISDYSNADLSASYLSTQTSNGTAVAPITAQAQPTVVVPGLTAAQNCYCAAQTLPATWLTGVVLQCLPNTNAAICYEVNAGAATITPTAVTVNIRIQK